MLFLVNKKKINRTKHCTIILSPQLLSQKSCATVPSLSYISVKKESLDNSEMFPCTQSSVTHDMMQAQGRKSKGLLDHYSRYSVVFFGLKLLFSSANRTLEEKRLLGILF